MNRKLTALLAVFVLFALLFFGGLATAIGAASQRAVAVRGWADRVQTPELPRQVPLAGVNVELRQYDPATLDRELGKIAAAGFVWVRQTFAWQDIEPAKGEITFAKYDPIVKAVAAHPPLNLVAVLDGSPAGARRPEASDRLTAPPASMAAFGEFAAQLAAHYAAQLDYYQVWDEPNLNTQWGGLDPQPTDYAAMLQAAYTGIHGHDDNATVIAGALAPTVETGPHNLSDVLYLRALYATGAGKWFDAAAGKPYGFNTGPNDRVVKPDVLNFSHIILLREEMLRNGDGRKALWGSNFGWNHLPDDWKGPPSIWGQVSAETQKRYTREAYLRAAQEWPWMGGVILEHWQPAFPADDPHQGFAESQLAGDWFSAGAFFTQPTLVSGLYDPANPAFKYSGERRFGPLGADVQYTTDADAAVDGSDHQLTFTFTGESLAVQLRRAIYVAYVYARIDGQAANGLPTSPNGDGYVLLKSPDLEPHTDLIMLADKLAPSTHTADIRFYLGKDQWALAGIAIGAPPDTRQFDVLMSLGVLAALIGAVGMVGVGRRFPWRVTRANMVPISAYLRRIGAVVCGLVVSGIAVVGMLLTWNGVLPDIVRRDTPTILLTVLTAGLAYFSPAFILTLVALVVLWMLIYNRPTVGLTLTLFWAPFFLAPVQLYVWALPFVEVSLLMTASAMLVRALVGWFSRRSTRTGFSLRAALRSLQAMDWAVLLFVGAASLTLLWAEQRAPALREWRIIILEPALYYVLLRLAHLTKQDLLRLVDVLLLAAAIIVVLGLIGYVFDGIGGVVVAEQGSRRLASAYGSDGCPP